jgi:PKD domain-containing protein
MNPRPVAMSLVVLVASAATSRAEAVAIDHKAVGCIVVGKYPRMNACFTPTADLARSRVYFRPEGVSSWYYVDMKSDQPCFTGTLPKPGKKLVGKKIEYYVEAQNKAFEPARTAEFDPIVVKSVQECKKNVPVAPFLNNATVAVFPSIPAGFVGGGIGTAAVVGIVGAGAAAAGTAAVVASNNNNDTTTTTTPVVANSTTTTTTLPPTTTTTTLPSTNHPPFAVLTTNPDPPSGTGPLTVTFDLCKSTDPDKDPLSFFFDFGDGGKASGSCLETHTYQASFRAADSVRALDKSYTAEACVVDPGGLSACRSRNVNATSPPPPPPSPSPKPSPVASPTLTFFCLEAEPSKGSSGADIKPPNSSCSADPSDTLTITYAAGTVVTITTTDPGASTGNLYACWGGACPASGNKTPADGATCTLTMDADKTASVTFQDCPCVGICTIGVRAPSATDVNWVSQLDVPGATGQLTINGVVFGSLRGEPSARTSRAHAGENLVQAQLVQAAGKPGTWRIELETNDVIELGSLRVIRGEVALVTATAVVFRLKGEVGEQVAFAFQMRR